MKRCLLLRMQRFLVPLNPGVLSGQVEDSEAPWGFANLFGSKLHVNS